MHKINILLLSIAVCLGTACNKKGTDANNHAPANTEATVANSAPTSTVQPTNPVKHAPYAIEDSSKIKDLGNGLKLYLVKEGNGTMPSPTSTVTINYQGRLKNGNVFDDSYARPEPANFPLTNLIRGWQIGLTSVKMGSSFVLIVPPELGYGSQSQNNIPPNSTLIFDIDLITFY